MSPDFTQSYLSWIWADISEFVRWETGVWTESGRRDQSDVVDASTGRLTLDNRDGRFSRNNPNSPYYGMLSKNTPIWLAVDPGTGFTDRYMGFVNEWPKRWDRSATDSTVEIVCGGPLRRLLRQQPLRSPMFRSMSGVAPNDYQPAAYWSMEDGPDATQVASSLVGGQPLTADGLVEFAADSTLVGSDPLLILDAGASLAATIPAYTSTGQWVFQFAFRLPLEPVSDTQIVQIDLTGGYYNKYVVVCQPGSPSFLVVEYYIANVFDGSIGIEISADLEPYIYGQWVMATVCESDNPSPGNKVYFNYLVDDEVAEVGTGTVVGGAIGRPVKVTLLGGEDGISLGHLAFYTDPNFDVFEDASVNAAAMNGYVGEQAHERIARLCRESRIPFVSQAASSALLGPQPGGKLIDVLRSAEKASQGVMYEHQFGLGFQSLAERYNQPTSLNLDIALAQVAEDLEPDDSDLRFNNQWTANRTDGSSATTQGRAGASGVTLDDDEAIAEAEDTFGVQSDSQLLPLAGWLVHRDSLEDDYWPNVGINLAKNPELIPSWTALNFGARMGVANLMTQADTSSLDLIVEGHREHWNSREWTATMNTSPALVYEVGIAGDSTSPGAWAQTSDAVLAEDLDTTETAIDVTSAEDWTNADPAGEPLIVGGEVVALTAVAGTAPNWTFTVTRSLNDIVKAHTTGAPVRVLNPAVAVY